MKIDIEKISKIKVPCNLNEDSSWIWISNKEEHLFLGNKDVLVIFDIKNNKEYRIDVDFEYIEALTTTEKYVCFAEFGGEFLVYSLKDCQFVKQLNGYYAMNWGAASYKNHLFVSEEEDFNQFHLLDIEKEKKLKTYKYPGEWIEGYFLSGISCDDKYVVGLIENTEGGGTIYPCWKAESTEYITEFISEYEDITDPLLFQHNIAVENIIYNIIKNNPIVQLELENWEYIVYFSEEFIFTLNDDYNSDNEVKKIDVYSMRDGKKAEAIEIEGTDITSFKNPSKYFLIKLNNDLFLVNLIDLIKSN